LEISSGPFKNNDLALILSAFAPALHMKTQASATKRRRKSLGADSGGLGARDADAARNHRTTVQPFQAPTDRREPEARPAASPRPDPHVDTDWNRPPANFALK
jgi:hypothetical protein